MITKQTSRYALPGLALAVLMFAMQAATAVPTTDAADLKSPRPGVVAGYMPMGSWVDSVAFLPPPPEPGSAAKAADDAVFQMSRNLIGSARWLQAEKDAVLSFSKAAEAFQCALGVNINAEVAPHLSMLLRRTLTDAGLATYKAKEFYKRQRPFMAGNDVTCTPKDEAALRKDGSYPSGHAAVGWAWGLVLTEVAPERANALVQRGKAFGQSRAVCGVHWQSDVDGGQLLASAVVAQLHSMADFNEQLALARREFASALGAGSHPSSDCATEAKSLAQ